MPVPVVYIGIGTNLGARAENVRRGLRLLERQGLRILKRSSIYETEPVDMPTGAPRFLNLVVAAETGLAPGEVMTRLLGVERALGRVRGVSSLKHKRSRSLDLDLLFYDRRVVREPGLTVPHPRLHERVFVLKPLADIAPGLVHPTLHRRVSTLLKNVDHGEVRPVRQLPRFD
jgi:2-amino-4-hydroxy-6-hydroxymethyldihydropteridine diphosphokinase